MAVPIPTYFTNGTKPFPPAVQAKLAKGEVAKNLIGLGICLHCAALFERSDAAGTTSQVKWEPSLPLKVSRSDGLEGNSWNRSQLPMQRVRRAKMMSR